MIFGLKLGDFSLELLFGLLGVVLDVVLDALGDIVRDVFGDGLCGLADAGLEGLVELLEAGGDLGLERLFELVDAVGGLVEAGGRLDDVAADGFAKLVECLDGGGGSGRLGRGEELGCRGVVGRETSRPRIG